MFPVIWHRWGILVIAIIIASLIITPATVDALMGNGFYTANYWPKATAFFAAGATVGLVGYLLNKNHETWQTKHRFFFLPMEYWAAIITVITALISIGKYRGQW